VAGVAPFALVLQFPPRTPLETAIGLPGGAGTQQPILASHAIHRLVQSRMREEQTRQKHKVDKGKRVLKLSPGDQVYLRRGSVGMPRDLQGEQAVYVTETNCEMNKKCPSCRPSSSLLHKS